MEQLCAEEYKDPLPRDTAQWALFLPPTVWPILPFSPTPLPSISLSTLDSHLPKGRQLGAA